MFTTHQTRTGGPEVIQIVDVPDPVPDAGQVLVRMLAAGVNPVDVNVRSGFYPLLGEPPFTLGWDLAGRVEVLGDGVSGFAVGDLVVGLVAFPGEARTHAELVVADAGQLVAVPDGLGIEEAGALPLAGLTAWQAVRAAAVGPGDRVLVHRAAGGVGHLLVQLAARRGATVIGTASAEKQALVRDLGAEHVIDYRTEDVASAVTDVDIAFDLLGGDASPGTARVLRPGGLFVSLMPGAFDEVAARSAGVRFLGLLVEPAAADLAELAAWVASGQVRVLVSETVPLAEAAKAHEIVGGGHVTGKVVLVP